MTAPSDGFKSFEARPLNEVARKLQTRLFWPEIFATENIEGLSDAALVAAGLCAWGNVKAGSPPPESFGRVLVKIGAKLGISATDDSLIEYSKRMFPDEGGQQ